MLHQALVKASAFCYISVFSQKEGTLESSQFSQLELAMILACAQSGMANAKAKGKKVSRPHATKNDIPAVFYKHYPAFVSGNMNVSELTRICDLSQLIMDMYLKLIA